MMIMFGVVNSEVKMVSTCSDESFRTERAVHRLFILTVFVSRWSGHGGAPADEDHAVSLLNRMSHCAEFELRPVQAAHSGLSSHLAPVSMTTNQGTKLAAR